MDLGYGCSFEARGGTNEEVLKRGTEHAQKVHGMRPEDVTPAEMAKSKAAIEDL